MDVNYNEDSEVNDLSLHNPNSYSIDYSQLGFYYYSAYIIYNIAIFKLNKNSSGLLKKGVAKQSRIKSIAWHLRWLVRTRADIGLRPSGLARSRTDIKLRPSELVRSRTDIKLRPSAFVRTRTDFKLQTVRLVRSYKD